MAFDAYAPESLEAIKNIATNTGQTVEAVTASINQLAQSLGPEQIEKLVRKMGELSKEELAELGGKAAEETRRFMAGKPLEQWGTEQLMTQLPSRTSQLVVGDLSLWQLLCLVQHMLNNIPRVAKPSGYSEALREIWAPELVRRMQLELEFQKQHAEMCAAWALVRSGGASLEEVTPILDRLAGLSAPEEK